MYNCYDLFSSSLFTKNQAFQVLPGFGVANQICRLVVTGSFQVAHWVSKVVYVAQARYAERHALRRKSILISSKALEN